jgi:hypothetical protein
VRDALMWAGLPDITLSIDDSESSDEERVMLRAFIGTWMEAKLEGEYTSTQLIETATAGPTYPPVPKRLGPEETERRNLDFLNTERGQEKFYQMLKQVAWCNGKLDSRALGRWLHSVKGKNVGGFHIHMRSSSGVSFYSVRKPGVSIL